MFEFKERKVFTIKIKHFEILYEKSILNVLLKCKIIFKGNSFFTLSSYETENVNIASETVELLKYKDFLLKLNMGNLSEKQIHFL